MYKLKHRCARLKIPAWNGLLQLLYAVILNIILIYVRTYILICVWWTICFFFAESDGWWCIWRYFARRPPWNITFGPDGCARHPSHHTITILVQIMMLLLCGVSVCFCLCATAACREQSNFMASNKNALLKLECMRARSCPASIIRQTILRARGEGITSNFSARAHTGWTYYYSLAICCDTNIIFCILYISCRYVLRNYR